MTTTIPNSEHPMIKAINAFHLETQTWVKRVEHDHDRINLLFHRYQSQQSRLEAVEEVLSTLPDKIKEAARSSLVMPPAPVIKTTTTTAAPEGTKWEPCPAYGIHGPGEKCQKCPKTPVKVKTAEEQWVEAKMNCAKGIHDYVPYSNGTASGERCRWCLSIW
jgi:hypothetical protein